MVNKKIKKISYPTKYKELIKKYGEEEGNNKYYKFIRGVSLEKYILKYGEEEGKKRYDDYKYKIKKSGVSIDKMIKKYGEEEGKKRYEKWKNDVKQNLNNFIKRYGEEEGKKRYELFKKKSLKALEKVDNKNKLSIRKLNYWLKYHNGNIELAKKSLKEYQNKSSLDKFIKRYGKINGKNKYLENNVKKAITLENMIRLHGEVKGKEKYENWKNFNKNTKSRYIKKYGKEKGEKIYQNLIIKKTKKLNRYSHIGLEFCDRINNFIKHKYNKIYYGDNEYMFFIFEDDIKIISPDIYIKDINLVIEFYGDFWHKNPKYYKQNESFVKETWENDNKRINKLKEKFNCDIIIIWESDYKQNKEKVINNIIEKININYGNY